MARTWDAEVYRERARMWREEADALPDGEQKKVVLVLAEGYENLANFIEKRTSEQAERDCGSGPLPEAF